ncbi:hypothetical protein ACKI2C_49150, partial [Streptomyces brasiliscabiei]|uniref:hypothetical protein n=1 Tax=Streptomyces brasiliscabiei TaxID=2736302 RepID=UPI0038F5D5D7
SSHLPATVPAIPQQTEGMTPLNENTSNINTITVKTTPMWLIIVCIIGYLLCLITLLLWWRSKTTHEPNVQPQHVSSVVRPSLSELKAKSKSN